MWSMNGPHTPLSLDLVCICHLRAIFFGCPYTCVMYGIRQCNRVFSGAEISAFFAKIFFQISVVILNSTLHSQILEFDIIIQILIWIFGSTMTHTYTVSGQYYLYWPHTPLSGYRVCYFLVPHTHVLCMGSAQAVQQDFFYAVRLVYSLLKYFFKFQLWYWIQIYTTKYSNLLLIILILVWIVCSTYRKGEILMQKWHVTSQFVYCYMPYC